MDGKCIRGMNVKRSHEACEDEPELRSSKLFGPSPLSDHRPSDIATSPDVAAMRPCSPAWGCQSNIGRRANMEDAHTAGPLLTLEDAACHHLWHFAIYDGHGGCKVAKFLAANAQAYIERALLGRGFVGDGCCSIATALRDAFLSLDQDVPTRASKEIGGSTAVCVVISDQQLICANCGDSRAVLSRSDGIVALSDDHKPERSDEAARIRRAGGRIFNNGGARVMGMLNMTRAIGDTPLQRFGVSPEPEIVTVERSCMDEFVIVASDGLWGSLTSQEAVVIVQRCLERAAAKGVDRAAATRIAAKVLVHAAMRLGSRDNITVMVVDVQSGQAAPSPNAPAQAPPVLLGCIDHGSAGAAAPLPRALAPALQLPHLLDFELCLSSGRGLLSAENLLVHLPAPQDGSAARPPGRVWCSCEAVPNCCNGASSCLVELPEVLPSSCCPSDLRLCLSLP